MYMLDQASLARAATGPPLSTHLPLHQGELVDYSGGRPDHYVTHRWPGCGSSGDQREAQPCAYMLDQASLARAATGPPLSTHLPTPG